MFSTMFLCDSQVRWSLTNVHLKQVTDSTTAPYTYSPDDRSFATNLRGRPCDFVVSHTCRYSLHIQTLSLALGLFCWLKHLNSTRASLAKTYQKKTSYPQ